ncbi:MAG: hypothetical protein HRT81_17430 [Henriciella sp.]|nr:hypothetical protein [Henriciella sp.]
MRKDLMQVRWFESFWRKGESRLPNGPQHLICLCLFVLFAVPSAMAQETELELQIEPEFRYFFETPSDARQVDAFGAVAIEATLETLWEGGAHSFIINPRIRLDIENPDDERFDFRSFHYEGIFENFELRLGVDRVFWGVTEFAHFVDVINQTDSVESLDGEEKLGQLMLNITVPSEWGTFDFFILPAFRERTFEGVSGRPRLDIPVDVSRPIYEDPEAEKHVDYSARWSHYVGNLDVGLAYFKGTGREPSFVLDTDENLDPVLRPRYSQIEQGSVDVQMTLDVLLLKFEGLVREELGETSSMATGGFEYSVYGAFGTSADIGMIVEYAYDERGSRSANPYDNDIFAGVRLGFNDANATSILGEVGVDLNTQEQILRIEAQRRLNDNLFLRAELYSFSRADAQSPLNSFRDDDFFLIRLAYQF